MKRVIMAAAVTLLGAALAYGQSAGGGISFFVPESLLEGSGSISKEAGLSTSVGFGDVLSVPVGFTYIKASGVMGYEQKNDGSIGKRIANELWYTADTFIPYLRAETHIPIGPVFVEGFAGVAGVWFVAPQINEGAFGRDYAGFDGAAADLYAFSDLNMDISLGYGYQVGGAFGVQIDKIQVKLTGIFTDLKAETKAKSETYYEVDYSGTSASDKGAFDETFWSRLRGFSIGINGSFSM